MTGTKGEHQKGLKDRQGSSIKARLQRQKGQHQARLKGRMGSVKGEAKEREHHGR